MKNDRQCKVFHKTVKLGRPDFITATITGATIFFVTIIWFAFDHHVPMMDEAGHILRGLTYGELFSRPRPLDAGWWRSLLTVSQFYPPLVYVLTGLIKAATVNARYIDVLVQCSFSLILTGSMVLAGRLLGLSLRASAIAAIVINLFPGVSASNHQFMLDFPALAAVGLGLLMLLLWRNRPDIRLAIAAGVTLGLCCMVKQVVVIFLFGAALFMSIEALSDDERNRRRARLRQFGVIIMCAILVVSPWTLTNQAFTRSLLDYMENDLTNRGLGFSFFDSLMFYLGSLYSTMSPFLLLVFLVSLMLIGREGHRKLLPVSSLALAGIGLMSFFIHPLERYVLSALVFPAFCLGKAIDDMLSAGSAAFKASGALILAIACLQFISFTFTAYPIPALESLTGLSDALHVRVGISFGKDGRKDNPVIKADWGYDWVLKTIESRDGNAPVYLNVMANHPRINAQTFDLYSREYGSSVRATTSRVWTIVGDEVDFNEQSALYHHWYLFKTGDSGFQLKDDTSRQNYERLYRFVTSGNRFEPAGTHRIADGSLLQLFRQLPAIPGSQLAFELHQSN